MGSLSNLYISQSYQSLIHLGTNNTASATIIELQDGLGNNLGVGVNTLGHISASGVVETNNLRVELDTEITGGVDINTYYTASTPAYTNVTNPYYTNVVRVTGSYAYNPDAPTINEVKVGWICNGINVTNGVVTAVSGSGTGDVWVTIDGEFPQINQTYTFNGRFEKQTKITGSLNVSNDITASNIQLSGDMFVSGTIHAYELITTVESASVILSSGSNVIGDDITDTQTIVGQTSISGSLTVKGPFVHTGSVDIVGDVDITGSLFVMNEISSSTIAGLGNATQYSQSVDSRLDYIEGPFSTSVDQRLDSLEIFSASEESKNITLSQWTSSADNKFTAIGTYTSSMNVYTQSNDARILDIQNYTSSLRTAFTASGTDVNFNGNINVVGSINAYEIHTIIESSSVIFSSGSNVLGDSNTDTQTLNGEVYIPFKEYLAGNPLDTNTRINQKLDTASFDNFVNNTYTPFSQSVDSRLDNIEAFTASLVQNFVTEVEYSQSIAVVSGSLINQINTKLDTASFDNFVNNTYTPFSSSVDFRINQKLNSASFDNFVTNSYTPFSSSVDSRINTKLENSWTSSVFAPFSSSVSSNSASFDSRITFLSASKLDASWTGTTFMPFSSSVNSRLVTLENDSLTHATTGSNTFFGVETISGSLNVSGSSTYNGRQVITGSVLGNVTNITVTSQTASIDCSKGNFFTVSLPTGSTYITATNISAGQTISLRCGSNTGRTVQIDTTTIKFPSGLSYTPSQYPAAEDLLTFVSFDGTKLYGVSVNLYI